MALNKYMHPRNIYKKKRPNFKELAIRYPDFRSVVSQDLSGKVTLDFKSPEALRALTCTLLKDDFGLDVELPLDRLIPTVPLRLNYVLWIQDIMGEKEDVVGLDIGAGASCIYPLLGCKLRPTWKFICSEVEDANVHFAKRNINFNDMQENIELVQTKPTEGLYELLYNRTESLDFCMCNPPFYADSLEAQGISNCRNLDRPEPKSINTGIDQECIVLGGEFGYIKKMIDDSLKLKDKVRVYTTMVGRKSDVGRLRTELKKNNISNIGETEFCQGRTMRWGLAWTFDNSVMFPKSEFQAKKKKHSDDKPPLSHIIPKEFVGKEYNVIVTWIKIKEMLDELKVQHKGVKSTTTEITVNLTAMENTWSHQRRKKRQQMRDKQFRSEEITSGKQSEEKQVEDEGVRISVKQQEVANLELERSVDSNQEVSNRKRKLESESEQQKAKVIKMEEHDQIDGACKGTNHDSLKTDLVQADAEQEGKYSLQRNSAEVIRLEDSAGSEGRNIDLQVECGEEKGAQNKNTGPQVDLQVECAEKKGDQNKNTGPQVTVLASTSKETAGCLLKVRLSLKQVQESVVMEMAYVEGQGRELMYQFMQYFKNRLK